MTQIIIIDEKGFLRDTLEKYFIENFPADDVVTVDDITGLSVESCGRNALVFINLKLASSSRVKIKQVKEACRSIRMVAFSHQYEKKEQEFYEEAAKKCGVDMFVDSGDIPALAEKLIAEERAFRKRDAI